MTESFSLDPQLAKDTLPVADLSLCTLRLMNDRTYTWFILVPMKTGLAEIIDLEPADRHRLMDEISDVSKALQSIAAADKLNVAALGNMVRQLHIHAIARHEGDAAWPGPIWGAHAPLAYDTDDAAALVQRMRAALGR